MTAAATSVLSLYAAPASVASSQEEATGGSLGTSSDTPAALPADRVLHTLGNGPASASRDTGDGTSADLPAVKPRIDGAKAGGAQGAVRHSALADGRGQGNQGHNSGYGGDSGDTGDRGDAGDSGYGGDAGDNGYGGDAGYGGDSGYGDDYGYGDLPPTKPPTTPPATPPDTVTPPVKSPPTTPVDTPPRKPPVSPPTQPPTLPETGGNEHVLAASGIAALLLTSGAILYRRGRGGSGR